MRRALLICVLLVACGPAIDDDGSPGSMTEGPTTEDQRPALDARVDVPEALPVGVVPAATPVVPPAPPPGRPDIRCTYSKGPIDDSPARTGAFRIDDLTTDFVDRSRQLDSGANRRLPTRIHYPSRRRFGLGPEPVADGVPFPLVIYAHGFSSSRDEAKKVGAHLASHGYIVVAPTFPLTSLTANFFNPDVDDVVNQPRDVSFLIDEMLARNTRTGDRFHGTIDANRIAVMGLSLGGLTTSLVTFHRDMRDPRIKVAATLAGPSVFFTRKFYDHVQVPLLMLHGDLDAFVGYQANARTALTRAAPNANLVSIRDGSHAAFGLPVDEWVLRLAAVFSAPENAHPDNPDGLGCGFAAGDLMRSTGAFLDELGGEEAGVVVTPEIMGMLPCSGDEYTRPALETDKQMAITKAAVTAFFEAYLSNDSARREAACRYLNEGIQGLPAATFE